MPSRLLIRLNDQIGSATSLLDADCLRAQRAAYRVRLGDFKFVDAELAALHARHDAKPRAAISAWVNLAEGLRSRYTDLGQPARDKIQRAHALSSAAGLTPIQALCAAWLAHLAYLRMDVPAIARYAGQALQLAAPDDHAARSRANLVVAQSFDEAGRADRARPWYERAHHHATTEGDDATLSAMMWNRAAVGLMNLRQQSCGGQSDAGLGVQSLQSLHPILRAQLLTESGSFAEALALFETHLNEALTQGLNSVASALLADQAWCRLQLSERDSAMADARAAQAHLHQSLTCGDRAPAHSRLAQVFDALQRQTEATRHQQMADVAWQGHADDQAQLLEALAPLTPYGAA